MKAYIAVGKIRFLHGLQYRAAAIAGISTQLFFGFIFMMIFSAFYASGSTAPPMPLEHVITYLWLQQALLALIMLWFRDSEIFASITSGQIACELCRPVSLYRFWYAKLLGSRLAMASLRCVPLLAIVFFIPEPYRMSAPAGLPAFLLFVAGMTLGLLLVVAISMLIYISVFWTMSPIGSIMMFAVFGELMAGLIVPVPLMPSWMQTVTYLFPFRWTTDFPFRVYSGHIPMEDALWGIGIQAAWIVALVMLGHRLMRAALRNVVVQGG